VRKPIYKQTDFVWFLVHFILFNENHLITVLTVTGGFTPDQQVEHYIRNGIPDEIPKSETSVVNHPTKHNVVHRGHNQSVRHQPVSTPIRMTNIDPPQQEKQQSKQEQALLRMSSDYINIQSEKDKLAEDNARLIAQMKNMRHSEQLRHAIVADAGFSKPEEIADRYLALREKQRLMIAENEELRAKLRLFENDMIASTTKKSAAEEQMKKYIQQAQRQSDQIDNLSGKVNSIQQHQTLCKEQEKIISKLEDLFSKTRISIDNRWKGEMDHMITMTRNRPRYDEQMFFRYPPAPVQYSYSQYPYDAVPAAATVPARGPTIQQLPTSYDLHDDYEAERYRNRVLERQLQDMAKSHAREKQGLMTKLEDLKLDL
jgi:hypothetical protein